MPLGETDDVVSAQIAYTVGEVIPRLFPLRELRVRVVPIVYNALADVCASVGTLADVRTWVGKPPNVRKHSSRTVGANQHHLFPERQGAFANHVKEPRSLRASAFV